MKKTIPILMLGIALMLASCSQNEDTLQSTGGEPITVTFTATPDGSMNQRAMKTRSVEDPTDEPIARAVLDIYDENNVQVGDRINGIINGNNITFTAKLEENKTYTCLFWADGAEEAHGNYDITDLRAIKLEEAWKSPIAYYASKTITASTKPESVTLTHAVSKVVLHETGTLSAGDKVMVWITIPKYTFNVEDGSFDTDGEPAMISRIEEIEIDQTTSGQLGSLYTFAPAEGYLTTAKLYYTPSDGSQRTTQIPNVPLKMNHRTVLKGAFAKIGLQNFNITLDKNWEGNMQMLITTKAGQIKDDPTLIESAINADGSLVIEGPVSSDDIYAVGYWARNEGEGKLISLDLSAMTELEEITQGTFSRVTSLTSIILPSSLKKIGGEVFYGCSGLTEIEIPAGVTSLGRFSFTNCAALESINLPEGLTTIIATTFGGCSALKEITIPAAVETIGEDALTCSRLESLVFEGNMEVAISTEEDPAAQAGKLVLNETITMRSGFNVFLPNITDKETAKTYKEYFGTKAKAVYYGYDDKGSGSKTDTKNYTKYE